jgi:Zn-dependent protease
MRSALNSDNLAQAVIFIALFVLVAGPVHECAHAFAALRLGDGTAKLFGRVSLDPIVHFDPVGGTLLIVSVLIGAASGNAIGFGWAKPTPVNPFNLRGRYANAIVAAAGPLSNLALAALFAIGFRILWADGVYPGNTSAINMLQLVFLTGVTLNVLLMLFNLIPVAPLDGSHVLLDLLDPPTARQVQQFMNQYGLILLIGVIFLVWRILWPIFVPIVNALLGVQYYL